MHNFVIQIYSCEENELLMEEDVKANSVEEAEEIANDMMTEFDYVDVFTQVN